MEEDFVNKQSGIKLLKKENLDELSISELKERILCLNELIEKCEKKIEEKKLSKDSAENIFKIKLVNIYLYSRIHLYPLKCLVFQGSFLNFLQENLRIFY